MEIEDICETSRRERTPCFRDPETGEAFKTFQFDQFVDKLLKADSHDVKIIEDYSDLGANTVSDDIVENTEDTMTLLEKYIDQLDVTLSKDRLKNTMRALYTEAQDLEM